MYQTPKNPTTIYSGHTKEPDLEYGTTDFSSIPVALKVSELDSHIRMGFIRKVYTLLSLQLLITWAMMYGVYRSPTATDYVNTHQGLLITAMVATFVFLFAAFCYGSRHPHGLLILLGFTLSESYCVSYIAIHYTAESVLLAWGATFSVFLGLTMYTFRTKSDFNFLGAALGSALWILIIGGIVQYIFLPNDHLVRTGLACLGAIVAVGYILYDTSDIMLRMTPDETVLACLNLYIDIIMLFTKLLELFGDRRD